MTRPTSPCVICQQSDRIPERGLVCEPCRTPLPGLLDDIAALYLRIDITPGTTGPGVRVSGSTEAPLPIRVDAVDLRMPSRTGTVREAIDPATKRPYGDQGGLISVASTLDSWVDDWRDYLDEGRPLPTVCVLAGWLKDRLPWACDHHPAVDEFTQDMRHLRATLRAVAGETPPKPEQLWTPCKAERCDKLGLYRTPGEAYPIQCRVCGALMTEDEYSDWSKLVAGAMKGRVAA